MANWQVQTWSGSAWNTASSLDNPWDITASYKNTDRISVLLSGEEGRVSTSTVVWNALDVSWQYKNKTFRDAAISWLSNNNILKFTDNSSSTISYIVKVNTISTGYVIIDGAIGYQLDVKCSQVRDPST